MIIPIRALKDAILKVSYVRVTLCTKVVIICAELQNAAEIEPHYGSDIAQAVSS
jgi:hypothetical protein